MKGNKREEKKNKQGKREKKKERERKGGFSWLFDCPRRKVDPRIAGFAWVPKSWSFVKLREVGNFPT